MSRTVLDSLHYIKERRQDFVVYRIDSDDVERLLQHLLPDPDVVLSEGAPVRSRWRSKSTEKVRVDFQGKSYFLKRYNCMGGLYRLKNLFRPSRALRSWKAASRFVAGEVPTPRPLICLEERTLGFLGRSYILFPFYAGKSGTLLELWPELNPAEQSHCLGDLGRLIGRMHHRGLFHGDLNWRNIIVQKTDNGFEFYLIDLDGSRISRRPSESDALKDIDHFLRDLKRSDARDEQQKEFIAAWQQNKGVMR